ncbi:hypothetical protein PSO31014_00944 [Pandoraea soli]|uniref:Uncharacterized protein n=1 Tax=Pandoraea soli TaxID=2508293 RepID=A0ABY6VR25_9BURK|nr:hypothetical protein PSO31014_00944 [Pandoraea soli]
MRHERQAFDAMSAWASRCTLIESARMFYGMNSLCDGTECRRNEEHRQPFDFCFYGPIAAIGFFYSSTDSASLPSRSPPYGRNPMDFDAISAHTPPHESDSKSIACASIHRHHWRCGNSPARAPKFANAKFRRADRCAAPIYFPDDGIACSRARKQCASRPKSALPRGSNGNATPAIRNGCQPEETRVFSDVYLSFQLFSEKSGKRDGHVRQRSCGQSRAR